jgi:hypothetical protein
MSFIYNRIKKLKRGDKQKEEKKEPVKQEPTEWEKICQDPKYFQGFEGENLPDVQKRLSYELSRLDFQGTLDARMTMDNLLKEAKESKRIENEYTKRAEAEHARIVELEVKPKTDESVSTDLENVKKAEKEYSEVAIKELQKAAELYRKLGTLALLRKEIKAKVDPNATDFDPKLVKVYFKETMELGYSLSYNTIIQYPERASKIASDHLATYQPKAVETKPETKKTTVESLKK